MIKEKLASIDRIDLANLPTPVYQLKNVSRELGKNIWIKRDDYTGVEMSGNKVRKLEYSIAQALKEGADVLITAGGIQSNHARATAAAAARLGLKSHLVLEISAAPKAEGNYLLDQMFGAEITLLNENEGITFAEKFQEIAEEYRKAGLKPYIIPVGASNGIGNFGYLNAVKEIAEQEKKLGVSFDAIVCATGSGGTYSGLYLGNKLFDRNKKIVGITVCDNKEYFTKVCGTIVDETLSLLGEDPDPDKDFTFIDGYKGLGYAISKPDELKFIAEIAAKEGIVLDPVYTGKAFYGLYNEVKKGTFDSCENILFIHTGGQYGLFPKQGQMAEVL
ncbi:MAG: D-cysteine desulfhydrase family protein [Firmicutes bacterium]|nr:D-cysteine desulfhydrase family protein [Bacillota bacterium]